ncbi:sodium-independent anion transporter [Lentibacillus cibarius]|uniref:Sodium-independent anion transporter n=1 Tax=Lentibacillus cibarius TaxID=2583219 RepID=A0A549YF72_9BACI|nr:SulP family inorganic anion transporter [Lentibacillus cibarius]TRM10534.1 sodium-independent anion transporter [Lentibacillus cibarius]
MLKLLPGLRQLVHYPLSNLPNDLASGMIVAFLLIPQSMAYAVIAGVPVVYGLVAAIFPLAIYALFGGSRYLSVGPVSIASLLAFSGVSTVAQHGSEHFLTAITLLTLIVGGMQILLSIIKFGTFFESISPAVISGFTSAAAIIIGLTQIKSLMGITVAPYRNVFDYVLEVIHHLSDSHSWTVIIGAGSLVFLMVVKRVFRSSLGPLMVIVASSLIVGYFHLDQGGVEVIGDIPQKLPALSLEIPTISTLFSLLPSAFMIAFISFAESYAIGKTLAANDGERLNPEQELFGLGLANITSSITGAIPVAGAISRTAVNHQAGGKSNISSFTTVVFVLITLLYLTPFLYFLPKTALAAIIIFAVSNLIDINGLRYYIQNDPGSAFLMLATFFATLMVDIFAGLMVGIFLSLLVTFIKTKVWHAT